MKDGRAVAVDRRVREVTEVRPHTEGLRARGDHVVPFEALVLGVGREDRDRVPATDLKALMR